MTNRVVLPARQPGYIGWHNRFLGIDFYAPQSLQIRALANICTIFGLETKKQNTVQLNCFSRSIPEQKCQLTEELTPKMYALSLTNKKNF
jgi:hypothetical protein